MRVNIDVMFSEFINEFVVIQLTTILILHGQSGWFRVGCVPLKTMVMFTPLVDAVEHNGTALLQILQILLAFNTMALCDNQDNRNKCVSWYSKLK